MTALSWDYMPIKSTIILLAARFIYGVEVNAMSRLWTWTSMALLQFTKVGQRTDTKKTTNTGIFGIETWHKIDN